MARRGRTRRREVSLAELAPVYYTPTSLVVLVVGLLLPAPYTYAVVYAGLLLAYLALSNGNLVYQVQSLGVFRFFVKRFDYYVYGLAILDAYPAAYWSPYRLLALPVFAGASSFLIVYSMSDKHNVYVEYVRRGIISGREAYRLLPGYAAVIRRLESLRRRAGEGSAEWGRENTVRYLLPVPVIALYAAMSYLYSPVLFALLLPVVLVAVLAALWPYAEAWFRARERGAALGYGFIYLMSATVIFARFSIPYRNVFRALCRAGVEIFCKEYEILSYYEARNTSMIDALIEYAENVPYRFYGYFIKNIASILGSGVSPSRFVDTVRESIRNEVRGMVERYTSLVRTIGTLYDLVMFIVIFAVSSVVATPFLFQALRYMPVLLLALSAGLAFAVRNARPTSIERLRDTRETLMSLVASYLVFLLAYGFTRGDVVVSAGLAMIAYGFTYKALTIRVFRDVEEEAGAVQLLTDYVETMTLAGMPVSEILSRAEELVEGSHAKQILREAVLRFKRRDVGRFEAHGIRYIPMEALLKLLNIVAALGAAAKGFISDMMSVFSSYREAVEYLRVSMSQENLLLLSMPVMVVFGALAIPLAQYIMASVHVGGGGLPASLGTSIIMPPWMLREAYSYALYTVVSSAISTALLYSVMSRGDHRLWLGYVVEGVLLVLYPLYLRFMYHSLFSLAPS